MLTISYNFQVLIDVFNSFDHVGHVVSPPRKTSQKGKHCRGGARLLFFTTFRASGQPNSNLRLCLLFLCLLRLLLLAAAVMLRPN